MNLPATIQVGLSLKVPDCSNPRAVKLLEGLRRKDVSAIVEELGWSPGTGAGCWPQFTVTWFRVIFDEPAPPPAP